MQFVNGVDVSDYQPGVDWKAVHAAGYSFAITKATEGTWNAQDTLPSNLAGIRAAGMVAGVYHFFSWTADPADQARHLLRHYVPQPGDLPPVIDCEGDVPPPHQAITRVSAFLATLDAATTMRGQRAMVYCSYAFAQDTFRGGPFSGHPLWVAAYNTDSAPPAPVGWPPRIWQWTDKGNVDGIKGAVDCDRFVGTLADLHAFALK